MDSFINTRIDWAGRHNYPNADIRVNKDGSRTIVRSNSCWSEIDNDIRPHHIVEIKKIFKAIRKSNTNPRLLKKINRDALRVLSGKMDAFDVLRIMGEYRMAVKPPRIHVERETKTEASAVA